MGTVAMMAIHTLPQKGKSYRLCARANVAARLRLMIRREERKPEILFNVRHYDICQAKLYALIVADTACEEEAYLRGRHALRMLFEADRGKCQGVSPPPFRVDRDSGE